MFKSFGTQRRRGSSFSAVVNCGSTQGSPRRATTHRHQRSRASQHRLNLDSGLKRAAQRVEEIIRHGQSIVDWQNKDDVQCTMRRDIKRELRNVEGLSEDQVEEVARMMVDVARSKAFRA